MELERCEHELKSERNRIDTEMRSMRNRLGRAEQMLMESRKEGFCQCCQVNWGAIHQFLRIIFNLRILVLLPVSTLLYVVKVKNCS
jgi:hypothetical protein